MDQIKDPFDIKNSKPIPDPVDYTFPMSSQLEVLFDGNVVPYCIEASVKGCYIIEYEKDENGKLRIDKDTDDFVKVRRRGNVEVRYRQPQLVESGASCTLPSS